MFHGGHYSGCEERGPQMDFWWIFGDADNNVGYVFFVKEDLKKAGHYVELSFATPKATMQNLDKIIIADEVL